MCAGVTLLLARSATPQPAPQPAPRPAPPAPATVVLEGGVSVLAPISYKNLTLLPVAAPAATAAPASPDKDYLVLDEGMKSGRVKVIEKGDDGSVNELILSNSSDKPVFLMAGEVVIGGKQDRIIGKDTVIPANSTEPVPVFCVEHGRWSGRKAEFAAADSLAHTELRKSAKFKSQQDVWQEVSVKNAARGASNDTDTYRAVATGERGVKASIAGYERHFAAALAPVRKQHRLIGFVVVMNGKVAAIEKFGSPALFRKLEPKLLRSYFVEAVDHPVPAVAPKLPSGDDIKRFATRAKKARKSEVHKAKAARTLQVEDDAVIGSEVEAAGGDQPAAAPPAPVYESTYAK
jgi:hypothetical protein